MNPKATLTALVVLTLVISFSPQHARSDRSISKEVWVPDLGNGTYKNPILYADYSDPDVIRVRDDFYLIASSFNCTPGIPILRSKDLVNWKIISHVLKQQIPLDVFRKPQHGNGVWAPAIRYHDGEFFVYYPDPDFGIYLVKAKDPLGPWSTPVLIKSAKGWIDPCPFWDEDGQAYLVHAWANSRAGIKSILTINRMSADGTRILDQGTMVFDGRVHHPTIEGPKLYKRNGYYYIFAPAGGVSTGWQTVLRSRNIYGPYEDKIVMDQGNTSINGPHQGAWVETQPGESWFIHFQDKEAYGRVVHLQPMKWINDWPVIGVDADGDGKGAPVQTYAKPNVGRSYPTAVPQTSDDFNSPNLGLQWQWQANSEAEWMALKERSGWLRLRAICAPQGAVSLWDVPNLLLQKLPGPAFTVSTKIDFSQLALDEKAGLIVMGADYAYVAVERTPIGFQLVYSVCLAADKGGKESIQSSRPISGGVVLLEAKFNVDTPVELSFSVDGKQLKRREQKFTMKAGKWIGAKVGLFAVAKQSVGRGHADFEWFQFR
jgi:beta-xylosidase